MDASSAFRYLLPLLSLAVIGCEENAPLDPFERIEAEERYMASYLKRIRAEILPTIAPGLDRINREARQIGDRTYVTPYDFSRVMFFVPEEAKSVRPRDVPSRLSPPANAIRKKWTDRFVVAQRLRYRYDWKEIQSVAVRERPAKKNAKSSPQRRPWLMPPATPWLRYPIEARVRIDHVVERHSVIVGEAAARPQPPPGYSLWTGSGGTEHSYISPRAGEGEFWERFARFLHPRIPGNVYDPDRASDEERRAVRRLETAAKEEKWERTVTWTLMYDRQDERWRVWWVDDSWDPLGAGPLQLEWEHGLERHDGVYRVPAADRMQPRGGSDSLDD